MNSVQTITALSALAQPTRLEVFRTLVRAGDGGMSAGTLAASVGTPPNTMSGHLAILTRAGLASAKREGRSIRYTAVPTTIRALTDFLTDAAGGSRE